MSSILELQNISKSYGSSIVLKDINLTIENNEFFTILGSSGSGKSTLLRIIGGFVKPSSGDLIFNNKVINEEPIFKRPFNTVFQDYALFPNMNVYNNIGFGLKIRKLDTKTVSDKVEEVLSIVGLNEFKKRMPHELSGGQQQRVALARAIVCEPKVILLDEPLGALDAELRKQMQLFLKDIQKKIKTTFIFITHDQEEAIFLSDRIAVLNNHQFEQVGTPKELYYNPKSKYLASFFGECNLIKGTVGHINSDIITIDTAVGKINIKNKYKNISQKQNITFAVRPEQIFLNQKKDNNSFSTNVDRVEFKGAVTNIILNFPKNIKIKVQINNAEQQIAINENDQFDIYFDPNFGNLFVND